ncbi:MAG: STAS/SEC14 domain-containing protein [Anaerolineae bacterium]
MAYQIVVENEYATVRYEPEHAYIYHTFHQPIRGEIFRKTMNTGLDALIHNHATRWLSDDRLNAEFTPEDVEFALIDWGPRAAQGGWKYWALVVPENIAGRAGMTDIISAFFELGVRVMVFSDLEKARAWLINVQEDEQPTSYHAA